MDVIGDFISRLSFPAPFGRRVEFGERKRTGLERSAQHNCARNNGRD